MALTTAVSLLIHLYSWLLRLYPSNFHDEFGEEMTAVFTQTIMEAVERSRWAVTAVCLHEIRDLPLNLAREHWLSLTKKGSPMNTIHKKTEWFFFPGWVLLSVLGLFLAGAITWVIVGQVENVVGGRVMINGRSRITEDWLAGYIFVPALALTTGLLQYLLLRRYLPRMGRWIGATTLGWLLAAVIGYASTFLPGRLLGTNINWLTLLMIALMAGLVSFMQWLALRRHVPRAGWWISATIVGWIAARLAAGEALTGPLDIAYLSILPAIAASVTLGLLINQGKQSESKDA